VGRRNPKTLQKKLGRAAPRKVFVLCVPQAEKYLVNASRSGVFYQLKRVCRTTFIISKYAAPWSAINYAARQRSSTVLSYLS
jgi:hypothetical protein